jgi:trigger factor
VAFEGGTANEQELVIGSHQFIPGFEEQMVGMSIDEERDLNVKFPEAYHAKELAGKDAVFHVKVLSISEKELPELNDEFASDVSEFETLDAYKEDLKKKLLEQKEKEATAAKEDAVLAKAVENASMEIPDPMIESQAEDMVNEFGERLQMQGMQLEQYLKYTGMSMKQIVDQYKEQAKKRIQGRLVLEAIVKAENIEATEEDVEEGLKKLAADYQMDIDKVRGFFDDESMVSYKKDLATQKALDLIVAESK